MFYTAIVVGAVIAVLTALLLRPNRYAKLPPGPRGLPILGNLLQLPSNFLFLKVHEWSKEYGPIFTLNLAGQRMVVISSVKVAGDVLDRLSAYTSGRPPMIKINQFLSRGNHMVAAQPGDVWRRLRKATHEVLNIRKVTLFQPMQEQEAAIMIRCLLEHPEVDLIKHFHRASSSISWRATYGGPPLTLDSHAPSDRSEEQNTYIFQASLPGKSLMDMFPPLRHVYARSKWLRRNLDDWYLETTEMYHELYNGAQDASVLGNSSVSNNLSKLLDDDGIDDTMKAWTAGVLFASGLDTTATSLRYFVLAMVLHPEVVHKAHTELDAVVGDRTPTFEDRNSLPYISAIVKEVSRWRPDTPLGGPHAASEDFVYDEYIIPRGTLIMDNLWTQTRDPAVYDNAETFDPSRFLDSEGQFWPGAPDSHDDWLTFGHGRRVCPGRDLASNSLFITFAVLLWAFEFRKSKDQNGKEVEYDDMALVDNFITVQPAPFKADLVPRFQDIEAKLEPALT